MKAGFGGAYSDILMELGEPLNNAGNSSGTPNITHHLLCDKRLVPFLGGVEKVVAWPEFLG